MIERGLVVRGRVVPGTELVRRIPGVGWSWETVAHRPDLKKRPEGRIVDLSTWHWTAGPIRVGEDVPRETFAKMLARKRDDGSDMSVSIHLVVGWDGIPWQLADLGLATIHAGRAIDPRAIGTELTWPGSASNARAIAATLQGRKRAVHPGYLTAPEMRLSRGHRLACLPPSPELLQGAVALAELLTTLPAELGIVIPRQLASIDGVVTARDRGAHEHQHVAGSKKLDCAGYVVDALAAAGWGG